MKSDNRAFQTSVSQFNNCAITVSTEQSTKDKKDCLHISLSFFDLMDKVYHLEGKWQYTTFFFHPFGQLFASNFPTGGLRDSIP